jgi:hypothetical protein
MPQVGFEQMIPVLEREKTVHALDRAVTVIGISSSILSNSVLLVLYTSCVKWTHNGDNLCPSQHRIRDRILGASKQLCSRPVVSASLSVIKEEYLDANCYFWVLTRILVLICCLCWYPTYNGIQTGVRRHLCLKMAFSHPLDPDHEIVNSPRGTL